MALRDLPRPEPEPRKLMTLEEFDLYDRRRFFARCIAKVRVFPRSKPQRLTLRWHGSEEEIPVPAFAPQELPVAA